MAHASAMTLFASTLLMSSVCKDAAKFSDMMAMGVGKREHHQCGSLQPGCMPIQTSRHAFRRQCAGHLSTAYLQNEERWSPSALKTSAS